MDKNQHSKADAEFWSPHGPINSNKSGKTEQEFELEDGKKESLEFGEKKRDWGQWPKPFYPFRVGLGRLWNCLRRSFCCCQFLYVIANPLRLLRIYRQQGQTLQPSLTCLFEVAMCFQTSGMRCQLLHAVAVDKRMAVRTVE